MIVMNSIYLSDGPLTRAVFGGGSPPQQHFNTEESNVFESP